MNNLSRIFATGGLITDTGIDADRPPPWLKSGCTHYVPDRDGVLVDAEQTKKWRPQLEMINRSVSGADGVHAVRPLVNEREASVLRAAGAQEGSFDVCSGVVKLSAHVHVSREMLEDDSPGLEADVARWRAEREKRQASEDARHAELLAAGGVVTAVARLHSPEGHRECGGCDGATEYPPGWPCRTWELLDETVPR